MMPDLRARLKAVAAKQKEPEEAVGCYRRESRIPLSEIGGPYAIMGAHVQRLGLALEGFDLERTLFLDTETTGLRGAGTVAFLVGLGWVENGEFVVRQLLMRDYPEEAPLLAEVADLLPRYTCVVSFNGKSFDMPLLRDRFTMMRLRDRWRELPQLDLLHASRRTWKMRLGSCTLGRLEAEVLHTPREGDLPGAEVPERYFQFLKNGDFDLLEDVLRHNEQDIRTLYTLLMRLSQAYQQPEEQTSLLDVFSIGRALEQCGEAELARRCFRVASVSALSKQARLQLAQSYRRSLDYAQAAQTYREMVAHGEADHKAYTALAILLERYMDDLPGALQVTEQALWRFSGESLLSIDAGDLQGLERRRMRLKRRIAKRQQK